MNRSQKTKILSQLIRGETALLRQLKRPDYLNRPLTKDELRALTGEQIIDMGDAGIELPVKELTTIQIVSAIKALGERIRPEYAELDIKDLVEVLKVELGE